jgi:hypothetical protein
LNASKKPSVIYAANVSDDYELHLIEEILLEMGRTLTEFRLPRPQFQSQVRLPLIRDLEYLWISMKIEVPMQHKYCFVLFLEVTSHSTPTGPHVLRETIGRGGKAGCASDGNGDDSTRA